MSKTVFRPAPPLNRSKKWVIHTRPGDLGSKTAKQLYNSYQICSDHFEDSQYMDPAHTSLIRPRNSQFFGGSKLLLPSLKLGSKTIFVVAKF